MECESPEEFLRFVLRAIAPYLDILVLVGGFAVSIYRLHPRAAPTQLIPLLTFDVDFAVPEKLQRTPGQGLSDLVAAAGLVPHLFGDHIPPVMKFFPRKMGTPTQAGPVEHYCVEFLTPLVGPPTNRRGEEIDTTEILPGITAQRLGCLDLLLVTPWQVPLAALLGIQGKGDEGIHVRVPHPGLLVVQKILISEERSRRGDRAKDMASIYDVLGLFRSDIPPLAQEVRDIMGTNPPWQQWLERCRRMAADLFGTPNSPGVTEAQTVLAVSTGGGESPTPAMIHAAVQAFLKHI